MRLERNKLVTAIIGIPLWKRPDRVVLQQGEAMHLIRVYWDVVNLTGSRPERYHVIPSFLDGLKAAGHEVDLVLEEWRGFDRHAVDYMSHPGHAHPAYFFAGMAYGLNQWNDLARLMRREIGDRWRVFWKTARHYQALAVQRQQDETNCSVLKLNWQFPAPRERSERSAA